MIGTGASGVQVIQESATRAKHLTVYQRTPNLCCPMKQKQLTRELDRVATFQDAFKTTSTTFSGFHYDSQERNTFDDTPEERQRFYRRLLVEEGGFRFWLNNYKDLLWDEKANAEAYAFWRDTVRSRLVDERTKEILAPTIQPHPWGAKRPSLEQRYYEMYNLPHVDLVDLNEEPIVAVTPSGIQARDHTEVDVIILATGFDAISGSLSLMDIRNAAGQTVQDHWRDGLRTSLGVALEGFPNMFFLYGPGAPTALANGPSCIQVQAEWFDKVMEGLLFEGIVRFEGTKAIEQEWADRCHDEWYKRLFPRAKSWYQGSNIPGKRVEPLSFAGGLNAYKKALDQSIEGGFGSWNVARASVV